MRRCPPRLGVALVVLSLAGCGSSGSKSAGRPAAAARSSPGTTRSSPTGPSSASAAARPAPAPAQLGAAEHPSAAQFPAARGRSLRQLGALAASSAQFGAATGTFTPGTRRLAFGLNASSGEFVYAPTAVYVSRRPGAPASGPFLAPADPMSVAPADRSRQNAGPGGIKAIYAARLPIPRAGTYTVLSLTRTPRGLVGAPGEIAVAPTSPIPDVGQRAPRVATDTPATVSGQTSLLSTRLPPEHMQSASLAAVLGRRPVALLFSTPQFCVSRVCGPVTDVAVALQHRFGNRVTFIHEEVFVHNQPGLGLRPSLRAFHLRTEPWLFTIDRHGVITARLEGAFGTTELAQALRAALR